MWFLSPFFSKPQRDTLFILRLLLGLGKVVRRDLCAAEPFWIDANCNVFNLSLQRQGITSQNAGICFQHFVAAIWQYLGRPVVRFSPVVVQGFLIK